MKNKILQYAFISCSVLFLFSSCRKESLKGTETKQSGKTFVYITESPTNSQFFDVFTDVKSVIMFTVRRDAASNADLQKPVTVVLTAQDQVYIDTLNAHNGTDYTLLPTSIYTLPSAQDLATPGIYSGAGGVTQTATGLTVNFAAGEFEKNIIFKVDGSKVDLSKQYAVDYIITSQGGFATKVGLTEVLGTIAIKNKYDGVYSFVGTMTDIANPALTHINDYLTAAASSSTPAPMQYELRTLSATSNVVYDNYLGQGIAVDITNAGGLSRYGSLGIVVTFDPATNKVASVVNYYGQPAGNTRSLQLDPTGANVYDPATKTVTIKYQMTQPSVITTPPYIRTSWDEVWTYLRSR